MDLVWGHTVPWLGVGEQSFFPMVYRFICWQLAFIAIICTMLASGGSLSGICDDIGARERRIIALPPQSILAESVWLGCASTVALVALLEWIEEGEFPPHGILLFQTLCHLMVFVVLFCGFLLMMRKRADEVLIYPGRATNVNGRRRRCKAFRSSRGSWVAILLLMNLVCAEGVGVFRAVTPASHQVASSANQSGGEHDRRYDSSHPCGGLDYICSIPGSTDGFPLVQVHDGVIHGGLGLRAPDYVCRAEMHFWSSRKLLSCPHVFAQSDKVFVVDLSSRRHMGDFEVDPQLHVRYDDVSSFMQVGPHNFDPIAQEMSRGEAGEAVVWFHAWEYHSVFRQDFRLHSFQPGIPGFEQVRRVWDDLFGRRACFVTIVRPTPREWNLLRPHLIITTVRGDTIFPVLITYESDMQRFQGTLILQSTRTVRVSEIFFLAEPMNQCVWQAECTITVEHAARRSLFT